MRKPSRRKCKVCGEYFVPKFHDIRIRDKYRVKLKALKQREAA
ncbi:hypothetical protein [Enterobacter kobei]